MRSISQEAVPEDVPFKLRDFLARRFIDVGVALQQDPRFTPRKQMPYKPQIGAVHYFDNPALHDYDPQIVVEGFWGLSNAGWVLMQSNRSVVAAYGGIVLVDETPGPDIDINWQTIPFTFGSVANPVDVIQDPANDLLQVVHSGTYLFNFAISMRHNATTNTGRVLLGRLNNVTSGVVTTPFEIGTGRDSTVTSIGLSGMYDIPEGHLLDNITAELSSVDGYTNVVYLHTGLSIHKLSTNIIP